MTDSTVATCDHGDGGRHRQRSQDPQCIPVIDMESPTAGSELVHAFKTVGFATLTNHGVSQALVDGAFHRSKLFFDCPTPTKLRYKYQGAASNRGYIPYQAESHTSDNPDWKETFDIGKEQNDEDGYVNQWPDDSISANTSNRYNQQQQQQQPGKFRTTMLEYFENFDRLFLRLMKMISIELKMEEDYLVDRCNEQHENLRLLHYPSISVPTPAQQDQEKVIVQRGNVHTDFGVLTLLCQDSVGGLRAQSLNGDWINVTPVPQSIVVNVGDMLQRWSNDVFRATPHQVISDLSTLTKTTLSSTQAQADESKESNTTVTIPERYSIAFFCNANKNVVLECLKECCAMNNVVVQPRYEPIKAHDYLSQRLNDTINA